MTVPTKLLASLFVACTAICALAPTAEAGVNEMLGGFLIVQPRVHDQPAHINYPMAVAIRFTNGVVNKTIYKPGEYEIEVGAEMGEPISASVDVVDVDLGNSTVMPDPHRNAIVGFYPEEPPIMIIPLVSIEITITIQKAHT